MLFAKHLFKLGLHYPKNLPYISEVLWDKSALSPPVKYFYGPFQGGNSFVDHLVYLCFEVGYAFASVHCCLVVPCWERADLLTLVCNV